ncbi:ABC transporter ATP-binding protein [Liberiplasma polymorphum]|uniref:ABC transporter ATP-binding protein n=1 Tax=Liberiplasma polymorphum TaxID=3374570 RepID=UPI0037745B6D
MRNINQLLRYALPYKKHMSIAIIAMLVQVFVGFYIPFIMKDIIDIALPSNDLNMVLWLSLFMLGLALLGMAGGIVNTYSSQYISQHASAELRLDLFNKIQTLSFKNIDEFKTSRLITNATNDIVRVQMFFTFLLRMIIRAPLMVMFGLFLAITTSIELSNVFFITIPLLIVSIIIIMLFAYPKFKKVQMALDDLNNVVLENSNAPQVIKSFVSQPYEKGKFNKVNENYRKINTSAETVMAFAEPIINMIFNLGVALILIFGAYYLNQGNPSFFNELGEPRVGLLMAFSSYSQQILIGLMMFAFMMIFISRADVSAARINEIFNAEIDLTNAPDAKKIKLSGNITFDSVDFGYGDNGNLVLKNVSFTIKTGEKIGIIGSTGSGKSSLVSLIPRLYDTLNGQVLLDGESIKTLDIETLRNEIGFVTQNAIIFSGSIGTNILQGNLGADLNQLEQASKDALIYDFVESNEAYFNYIVKSKGSNLSGGQKQRISIARALIRKPAILILDDATSAVDLQSERKILNAINALSYNPTLLCISQKVSTVRRMDKILVLNNEGQIDGFGTHDVLLKQSKVYQEISKSQLNIGGVDHA